MNNQKHNVTTEGDKQVEDLIKKFGELKVGKKPLLDVLIETPEYTAMFEDYLRTTLTKLISDTEKKEREKLIEEFVLATEISDKSKPMEVLRMILTADEIAHLNEKE